MFVTIHGGNEYFPYPCPGLRKICRFYIDKGADAVICHHAHVPGAYEVYKDKPIVYSLGNLIFDHPNPPEGWNQGYAFRLEYDQCSSIALSSFELLPYIESFADAGIREMKGEQRKEFLKIIENYKRVLDDTKMYDGVWNEFCDSKRKGLMLTMFPPFHFRGIGRLYDWLKIESIISPEKYLYKRFNLLQCESHKEVIQSIMKNIIYSKTLR